MTDWIETLPLGDLLVRAAALHAERAALVFPDERFSYRELLDGARHIARGLSELGVRPGEHVGLLMPNCQEFVEALFGVSLLGAVTVPINARYKLTELGYVIENADLVAILTSNVIEEHVDFTEVLRTSLPALASSPDPTKLDLPEAPRLRAAVTLRGEGQPGFLGRKAFDEFAARADADVVERLRHQVRVRDIATILYTSGTTSHPKGCMLTHEALSRGSVLRLRERILDSDHDVFWSAGPLFHIGSLQLFLGSVGTFGTYLADAHFDPGRALEMMSREGVTSAWPWFPAIIQSLLGDPTFTPEMLSTLRTMMLIGPTALLERVQALFPWARLINGCGMTETAGLYAVSEPDDSIEQRTSTGGTVVRGVEIRIVDTDTGEDLPPGEIGEILVRGYVTMSGYYRDPEKTADALDADGWLHTHDLYIQRKSGHLTFQGRGKDMLKVGGENVAAVEIEAFLAEHPAVRLAEVVGIPDPRLDEVPVAFVELHPGQEIATDELINFCRGRIAAWKVPRAVYIVEAEDWPMSATKVDKGALRTRLLEATATIKGTL
ncbi:MAG TPA: class I adenylate-forming enzyme family protein [Solirubrobacteraceae bacterium]|nr:class I adenylate-forming enzyme family protein [Solirubrobacteraceae bacterium]